MGLQENKSNLAGFSISTRFPEEPWREWGHKTPSSVSGRWMGPIFSRIPPYKSDLAPHLSRPVSMEVRRSDEWAAWLMWLGWQGPGEGLCSDGWSSWGHIALDTHNAISRAIMRPICCSSSPGRGRAGRLRRTSGLWRHLGGFQRVGARFPCWELLLGKSCGTKKNAEWKVEGKWGQERRCDLSKVTSGTRGKS